MPLCSADDFKPSDFKRLKRIKAVRETAEIAVELYNGITKRDLGLTKPPIVLMEKGLEKFVDTYFDSVATFKVRNKYNIGDRINQEKICAFLLKTCADCDGRALFRDVSRSLSDDFMEKLHNAFSFMLLCAFAGVKDVASMGIIQRDFQICMHQRDFMPDEWACLMMTAFVKAYGQPLGTMD